MEPNQPYPHPDLLAAYLSGNCTEAGQAEVEAWLRSAPGNPEELEVFRKIWALSEQTIPGLQVDTTAAWDRLQNRMDQAEKPTQSKIRRLPTPGFLWKAAAVLLPIVLGTFLLYRSLTGPDWQEIVPGMDSYSGLLPDGSAYILGQGRIAIPEKFDEKERLVRLEGEAAFEVKSKSGVPFRVECGDLSIVVRGTRFRVEAPESRDSLVVKVSEGRVVMQSREGKSVMDSLVLENGQTGLFLRSSKKLSRGAAGIPEVLRPLSRVIQFRSTPLEEVFNRLEAEYGLNITWADSNIAPLPLTSRFEDLPADTVLLIVTQSFELEYTRHGREVFVGPGHP